jgi:hypothetical protein
MERTVCFEVTDLGTEIELIEDEIEGKNHYTIYSNRTPIEQGVRLETMVRLFIIKYNEQVAREKREG